MSEYLNKRGKIEIEVSSVCRLIVAYRRHPIINIIIIEFDILSLFKIQRNRRGKIARIEVI